MKLIDYFVQHKVNIAKFAYEHQISHGVLYRAIQGIPPTIRLAAIIEKATDGIVTAAELLGVPSENRS